MTTDYNDDKSCSVWKKILTTGFWVIYPIMGVCLLHMLWLMNDRMDNIMINSDDIYEEAEAFKYLDAPLAGNVIKGLDIALLKTVSDDTLAKGAKIFATKCSVCHGAKGNNGIPTARKFDTDDFKNGRELSNVFKTITEGIPAGGMPSFDTESADDRVALAHFIRAFSKKSPAITDADVAKLDKEFSLTVDKGAPHQVPVSMAIELLVDEAQGKAFNVNKISHAIEKDHSASAVLFKSVTKDVKSTLVSLNNNDVWQKDLSSFVKFASINIQSNGLQSKVLVMDKAKLENLYQYLVGLYK